MLAAFLPHATSLPFSFSCTSVLPLPGAISDPTCTSVLPCLVPTSQARHHRCLDPPRHSRLPWGLLCSFLPQSTASQRKSRSKIVVLVLDPRMERSIIKLSNKMISNTSFHANRPQSPENTSLAYLLLTLQLGASLPGCPNSIRAVK